MNSAQRFSHAFVLALPLALGLAASANAGTFLFGGADASQGGYFGYVGAGFRPGADIDSSGFVIRTQLGYGEFHYRTGFPSNGHDDVTTGDLLLGWQGGSETTHLAGYVGVDYQNHDVKNDPGNRSDGGRVGAKGQIELYSQPWDGGMLLGIANYSTANDTYFTLAKIGFAVRDDLYLGPEVSALGGREYNKWRFGGHLTGFKLGPVGLGFSVGYEDDNRSGNGIYGGVGLTLRE